MARRIHITGASGTGTSTLARVLAGRLETQAFDTDDFFWRPTDPPFQARRPVADRLALMQDVFLPRADWVLAGSFSGWHGRRCCDSVAASSAIRSAMATAGIGGGPHSRSARRSWPARS